MVAYVTSRVLSTSVASILGTGMASGVLVLVCPLGFLVPAWPLVEQRSSVIFVGLGFLVLVWSLVEQKFSIGTVG